MKKYLPLFFLTLIISCKVPDPIEEIVIDYDAQNETDIAIYISDNNLNAQKSNSGLYYIIKKEGTGNFIDDNTNTAKVHYKSFFLNGKIFSENDLNGELLEVNRTIPGFKEGIRYIKEGGEITLIIPSRLGYGHDEVSIFGLHIPAGSVLIFDIKLFSIN